MSKISPALLEEAEELGRSALAELLDDGLSSDEALGLLAALVDAAIPLRALLPAPWGGLAEQYDGPAVLAGLERIELELRRDPAKIDKRADRAAERGHFLVAARRRARAAKLRNRSTEEP
jgi:hypothetical protein